MKIDTVEINAMQADTITALKTSQEESWASFAPMAIFTAIPAAALVKFAHVNAGHTVLDIACGTGVVAITAARLGAHVAAIDFSPPLLQHAEKNIATAKVSVDLKKGDVEALPFPDSSFDIVLSQFGHMFAPRAKIAAQEMLRVLKPGGTMAFSTWPADLFTERLFSLANRFSPLPKDVSLPSEWGQLSFIKEQFNDAVEAWTFDQGIMLNPALSVIHYRQLIERTLGPVIKFVQNAQHRSDELQQFRNELDALITEYFADNCIRQHYLMSRAQKKV